MRVVELDEKKLIGIRVVCPGDQYFIEIPKAAVQLKQRLGEIRDAVSPARLVGVFVAEDCSDDRDGYWVCAEVNQIGHVPDGMVSLVVPKQRYAVIRHEGPNSAIPHTYEKLHQWEELNNLERLRDRWHLEISDVWGIEGASEVVCDLYDTVQ